MEKTFNEWLYEKIGCFSDDMADEDYDTYYSQWEAEREAD